MDNTSQNNAQYYINNALRFNAMLTPKIITFVYWLGLAGVFFSAITSLLSGSFIYAICLLIGGSLGLRIWCELMIVLFNINANIQSLANKDK